MTETDLQTVTLDSSNPTPNTNDINETHRPYEFETSQDDEQRIANSAKISELHGVNGVLEKLGLKLKEEWLASSLSIHRALVPGFQGMDDSAKAKLCFRQVLFTDLKTCGAGVLPPDLQNVDYQVLDGPFVLQVEDLENLLSSKYEKYRDVASGTGRWLKLSMTDGVQRVFGFEQKPIEDLEVLAPAGLKVVISNVEIKDGRLLLVPGALEVLGGSVKKLDAARKRRIKKFNNRVHSVAWETAASKFLLALERRNRRTHEDLPQPTIAQLAFWNERRVAYVSASRQGSSPGIPVNDMHAHQNTTNVPLPEH